MAQAALTCKPCFAANTNSRAAGSAASCSARVSLASFSALKAYAATHYRARAVTARAYKVDIENKDGSTTTLEVEEGETILECALNQGLELPHDCKMGVCMTCPARLVAGRVDQSAGMLSEDVLEKGYALLCVSVPHSDCTVKLIEEDEILEEVLCA